MAILISIIIVVAAVILAIAICTAIFVGLGYLTSLITPLSLYQGCMVSLGSSFVILLVLRLILIKINDEFRSGRYEDYEEKDDDEDDDEDEDEYEKQERNEFLLYKIKDKQKAREIIKQGLEFASKNEELLHLLQKTKEKK